jgi:hypothetical protein
MVTSVGQNVRPSKFQYLKRWELNKVKGCMGFKNPPSKIVANKEFKNNQPTVRNNNIRSSLMTTRQLAESQLTECHVVTCYGIIVCSKCQAQLGDEGM